MEKATSKTFGAHTDEVNLKTMTVARVQTFYDLSKLDRGPIEQPATYCFHRVPHQRAPKWNICN